MKRYIIYITLFLAIQTAKAQTFSSSKVITTAIPSLRVYADPRAAGMANLGLATSADANSGFINLAKIPFAPSSAAIAINYTPWMRDAVAGMYLASVSAYRKIGEAQAVSGSLRYFNLGKYELHDADGQLLQTSKPSEALIDLGYSRKLSSVLSISIALRYIHSSLLSGSIDNTTYKPANGLAGDLSFFYNGLNDQQEGFTAGLALTNLGTKVSYTNDALAKEFIPANAGIGGAYTFIPGEDHKITLGADVNKLLVPALPDSSYDLAAYHQMGVLESYGKSFRNNDWRFSFGIEYTYHEQFSLRAGYLLEEGNLSERNGFSAGLGLQLNIWRLQIGYIMPGGNGTSRNPLSNTLLFGLLLDIGGGKDNN